MFLSYAPARAHAAVISEWCCTDADHHNKRQNARFKNVSVTHIAKPIIRLD